MTDIANKNIVLKLNRNWQPVGHSLVCKALVDLCAGDAVVALDIDYAIDKEGNTDFDKPTVMRPVEWDEWITLPIRPWDLEIHSPSRVVRVPTVVITKNYGLMPLHDFKTRPGKRALWNRDKGIDQYTGKKLSESEASMDHVIPVSKGGKTNWENVVLTNKHLNWQKGNHFNHEVGLKLIRTPRKPLPIPASALIREAKHVDWVHFIKAME